MITSVQNNQVKAWKKLQQRKYRKQSGTFLAEGFHLVEEAFRSNWEIENLLLREDISLPDWASCLPFDILSSNVFKEVAETKTPQGIVAVVKMQATSMVASGSVLLMDGVQDPGNLGTLIRTADALGFSQVILGKGTVDLYHDKVIRASQGSVFHLPVMEGELETIIPELKQHDFKVWASALHGAVPLQEAEFSQNTALIVGNEGEGIRPSVMEAADEKVKIPILGKAESFNVAVAAGILMYAITEGK